MRTAGKLHAVWRKLVADIGRFGINEFAAAAIVTMVVDVVRADFRAYVKTIEPAFGNLAIAGRTFCARLENACVFMGAKQHKDRRRVNARMKAARKQTEQPTT